MFGKSKRLKFTKGEHTTQDILWYIHVDIWGPSKTPSLSGSRYFLSLIDVLLLNWP